MTLQLDSLGSYCWLDSPGQQMEGADKPLDYPGQLGRIGREPVSWILQDRDE
jgi:hypothetical protein